MVAPTHRYWRPAAIRRDEEEGRHRPVGWLELFYDLVFVVIIATLATDLGHHLDGEGVIHFGLQFMAVFWVWNAFTYYTERFETDGLENRVFTFLAILTVAGLAVWAPGGLEGNFTAFVGSYLAARGLNILLWLRAGRYERQFLPIALRFTTGYLIAAAILAASLTTRNDALFGLAVVIEIVTPVFTIRQQDELPPVSRSKWPERFGLFTMIVLGETVADVIHALSTSDAAGHGGLAMIGRGILSLAVGFTLWWVYFDFIARRPTRPRVAPALAWVYLHLLMLLTITVAGVAMAETLIEAGLGEFPTYLRELLLVNGGAAIASIGVLETTLDREEGEPTHPILSPALKVGLGLVLAAVGLLDLHWTPTAALLACFVALAVPATYGAKVWYRRGQGAE